MTEEKFYYQVWEKIMDFYKKAKDLGIDDIEISKCIDSVCKEWKSTALYMEDVRSYPIIFTGTLDDLEDMLDRALDERRLFLSQSTKDYIQSL